jgi:hypothetical protein
MRSFTPSDDRNYVFISGSDGTMGRVSTALGTAVWCLESNSKRNTASQVVVLSFAIPQEHGDRRDMLIQVRQNKDIDIPLLWPEWCAPTVPTFQHVHFAQWIPLPNIQSPHCAAVIKTVIRDQGISESQTAHTMDKRCDAITKEGDDINFTQSLDYYVTMHTRHCEPCFTMW